MCDCRSWIRFTETQRPDVGQLVALKGRNGRTSLGMLYSFKSGSLVWKMGHAYGGMEKLEQYPEWYPLPDIAAGKKAPVTNMGEWQGPITIDRRAA